MNLIVWDSQNKPPETNHVLVLWRSFSNCTGEISIPELIEKNPEELRAGFLSWLYDIGELECQNQRVVDHLQVRSGISFWWMTLLAEKSNIGKSPAIDDAIRLLAFERWLSVKSVDSIVIATENNCLAKTVEEWSKRNSIRFSWQQLPATTGKISTIRRLYSMLPQVMKGGIWLVRHIMSCWSLRGVGVKEWRNSEASTCFVSYLFNLEPDASKTGKFASRYWTSLPAELQMLGQKTNWLHLWVKGSVAPTGKDAAELLMQFNHDVNSGQTHTSLDSFISLKVVYSALRDWIKLFWCGKALTKCIQVHRVNGFNLWPLLQDDWMKSIYGETAISNLLVFNLFEAAFAGVKRQVVGAYLQENQGWEFAMISAWRTAMHGSLFGVPHATIRFWDLRRFFDQRSYNRTHQCDLPLPDFIAVNGGVAKSRLVDSGFPEDQLVDVEALRYNYLSELDVIQNDQIRSACRILVLGDYHRINSDYQMSLLQKAADKLDKKIELIVKPHPNCPILEKDYPSLNIEVVSGPINTLLPQCHCVYTSSSTSAAVDAFCMGKNVISVLDPSKMNLSPLRESDDVIFVSSPEGLVEAIETSCKSEKKDANKKTYFYVDKSLSRWKRVLIKGHLEKPPCEV